MYVCHKPCDQSCDRYVIPTIGLNDIDVEGEFLVQRQVLWTVPQEILDKQKVKGGDSDKNRDSVSKRKEAWNLLPEEGPGEVS